MKIWESSVSWICHLAKCTTSVRLTKGLCATRDGSKNYYEIGEFIRKKKKHRLGPVQGWSRIHFDPQLSLSRCFRQHAFRSFKSALQSGKKLIRNKFDNVRTVNPDIFESDGDVEKSCPFSCRTINQYDVTTCMASFSRVNPCTIGCVPCGEANSIWIRYVWMWKFFNPEKKKLGI